MPVDYYGTLTDKVPSAELRAHVDENFRLGIGLCGETSDGYYCTLAAGHPGQHVATDTHVIAAWEA